MPDKKNRLKDYISKYSGRYRNYLVHSTEEESELASALIQIVEEQGSDIFMDGVRLCDTLESFGIEKKIIYQIMLLMETSGYENFVQYDEYTIQNDLNCLVRNAHEATGLSRITIIKLVSAIASALGYPFLENEKMVEEQEQEGSAYAVPPYLYEAELKPIREKVCTGRELTIDDYHILEHLTAMEIPEAKCFMGKFLMDKDETRAVGLLKGAASDGDIQANGILGDYYYDRGGANNWTHAYLYYTGYGTAALTDKRQTAVKNIMNQKQYNLRVLLFGAIFLAAALAMFFVTPAAALYNPHYVLRWIFLIFDLAAWGAAAIHYRSYPYDFINWLLPSMFGIWWIYLFIWLLS